MKGLVRLMEGIAIASSARFALTLQLGEEGNVWLRELRSAASRADVSSSALRMTIVSGSAPVVCAPQTCPTEGILQ